MFLKIEIKIYENAQRIDYSKSRILISRIPVAVEVKPVVVSVEPGNLM